MQAGWDSAFEDAGLFHLLTDSVRDICIFAVDPQGLVKNWNPGAARLFGYSRDEIVGQPLDVLFAPNAVHANVPQQELAAAWGGSPYSCERWQRRKDGSLFWSAGTLTPLSGDHGQRLGFAKFERISTAPLDSADSQALSTQSREPSTPEKVARTLSPVLTSVFDRQLRMTSVSEDLLRLWQLTREDVAGRQCLDEVFQPWYDLIRKEAFQQVFATGQSAGGQVVIESRGCQRIYQYTLVPILDEQGGVIAVAATAQDRTRSIGSPGHIEQREIFHQAIAELSSDYAFYGSFNCEGSVVIEQVSEGFERFYGMSMEQMNARGGWASVIHPDDHHTLSQTIQLLLAGQTDRGELRGVCSDGTVKWQSYLIVPIQDAYGRTVGLYGAATDITAQRTLTGQLRQQAETLSAILSATVDNIYLVDLAGRYRDVSVGGARILGLEPAQMIGRHWTELGLPADIMEPFDTYRLQALASGLAERHESTFTDPAGMAHHFEYTIAPVRGADGRFESVVVVSRDDTERKQAEERLREASAVLSSFYETAPVMMGVVEVSATDIVHLTDNAATARFFRTPPAALAGRGAIEMGVPGELVRVWIKHYRESEETGKPVRFEYEHSLPDGPHWVSAIVYCIERLAGGRSRCSYVAEDVTERKRVEVALREAEQRWRDLAEALPNLVWTDLPDGQCDYLSSQWETYTGIPVEELLGLVWLERVIHPDDRERTLACWMTAVADRGVYDLEYRIRRHDGVYHWFKTRGVPIRDSQGRIVKWFGTCTDIDDEKRAVENLRQSEERFSRFMQHLPGLAWTKNTAGQYVYANDAAVKAFNLRREDLYGRTDADIFPEATAAQFQENDQRALASETGLQVIETLKQRDGITHYSVVSKFPIPGPDGSPMTVGGVAIDITELKQAEEALRDADRRKDQFLATLAHELRNPLAPLRNSLEILRMVRGDFSLVAQTREMMERQVQHLVRLVDDLLDVSRVMRGKIDLRLQEVELPEIIARAVETVQPLIEANQHELQVSLPAEPILLKVDVVRLAQVISNLLTNSAKYTEPCGRIVVSARRDGSDVILSVRDTGIGIAPEVLPHVFDLFVQADHARARAQGGLGIGLTLVRNIVEMHGGTVDGFSAGVGHGSQFDVRLPILERRLSQLGQMDASEMEPHLAVSSHRILVVDDNVDAATSLALLLQLQGHHVQVAHEGESALHVAAQWLPQLVFLDLGMPGADGYEVARRIRGLAGMQNVILAALTGWGQVDDRRRTAAAGFDHHLVKPAEPSAIQRIIGELRKV